MKILLGIAASLLFMSSLSAAGINSNPWELNVYSTQNIGTANGAYGSDFQGIAGAGGNVYFSGFSLNLSNFPVGTPYSLYTGGSVNFSNGTISNGGIESQGNIILNSTAVDGGISGGGNLSGGNGTVYGNVNLGGVNTSSLVINGTVKQHQAYSPTVNQALVSNYFNKASQFWGNLAPTATTTNQFGQIQVQGITSGRNVVDLSLANINSSYGIALNGPSSAFVIFNITGTTTGTNSLKALSFQFNGGIALNDVLFNVMKGATLSLQGGTYASLLAPKSNITFSSGLLQGNLIAQNLYGAGQVDLGPFTGFAKDQHNFVGVPEPTTWLTLGSLLALVFCITKKRRQPANIPA